MSDRSSCQIKIGGTLPADQLPAFAQLIHEAQFKFADATGSAFETMAEVAAAFIAAAERGGAIQIVDYDIPGGMDEALEEGIARFGLTFVRISGSHFAYDGVIRYFDVGVDEEWLTDTTGMPALRLDEIKEIRDLPAALALMGKAHRFNESFRLVGDVAAALDAIDRDDY